MFECWTPRILVYPLVYACRIETFRPGSLQVGRQTLLAHERWKAKYG